MTAPAENPSSKKSIITLALDIIKGIVSLVIGGAVLLGGIAVAAAKFLTAEHLLNFLGGAHGAAEIAKNVNEASPSSIWQKVANTAISVLVVGAIVAIFCLIQNWHARRYLIAGDRSASRGKPEDAIRSYSKAIKERPEYALAFHNRGLAELTLGQVDQAQKDFARAHELDSSLPLLQI